MPLTYIHLSDIHFGQESGSENDAHDDVKQRLIDDAAGLAGSGVYGAVDGVILTGDIAYSGKTQEYEQAGTWLDRLVDAVGCARTAVMLVPGNHDIDRGEVSRGCELMIDDIWRRGDKSLDSFLGSDVDREVLFRRFAGYRGFARAYGWEFEPDGGFASDRRVELAPGRFLRFVGLNSALVCSARDSKGQLFLGGRQRILPRRAGEELVVLSHHPLEWLQDSAETVQFVKSRARVFMYGHEHTANVVVEEVPVDGELLTISAGAAVPPYDERVPSGYMYNLICFDWDEASDGLAVEISAREWNPEITSFGRRVGMPEEARVVLRCPNFADERTRRKGAGGKPVQAEKGGGEQDVDTDNKVLGEDAMKESEAMLRLRFFRDLSATGRVQVLTAVNALPSTWNEELTHNVERRLLDSVLRSDSRGKLQDAINEALDAEEDVIGETDG